MSKSTKAAAADSAVDASATVAALLDDPATKALLGELIKSQAATIAAEEIAKAKAETAAAKKAAKPVKTLPAVVFVDREPKKDKTSGDVITGRGAGMWPAKFGICPEKFQVRGQHTWVNAEIVRTVLDNVAECKKVLAQVDAANAAE